MTSGGHLIQPLAESRAGFKVGPCCSGLVQARFEDLHGWRIKRLSVLGRLFRGSTTPIVRDFFLLPNRNFPCYTL